MDYERLKADHYFKLHAWIHKSAAIGLSEPPPLLIPRELLPDGFRGDKVQRQALRAWFDRNVGDGMERVRLVETTPMLHRMSGAQKCDATDLHLRTYNRYKAELGFTKRRR